MHIEPGFVAPAKVMLANAGAVGVVVWGCWQQLRTTVKFPALLARTILATGFFSLFMQSVSASVGPSELHFVGAMVMYLTLGFLPTLVGFAAGLLLQGLIFFFGRLIGNRLPATNRPECFQDVMPADSVQV